MYLMVNPSKGVSSVFMGKWLAVVQRTARKMGHAIRQLVEPGLKRRPPLSGILELDEKYFDGKGTEKQASLLADQHQSQVRSALIASDQAAELRPLVERFIDQKAHLKTDQNWVYQQIGKGFARGDVHNNTAESFNSLLERARQGIFDYMSQKHLLRYLNEIGFRWVHRVPKKIITKNRRRKTVMVALPVIDMLCSLLTHAVGKQLRRTPMAVFEPQLQTLPVVSNPFFDHSSEIQLRQISDTSGTTSNTERR